MEQKHCELHVAPTTSGVRLPLPCIHFLDEVKLWMRVKMAFHSAVSHIPRSDEAGTVSTNVGELG